MRDVQAKIAEWLTEDKRIALATVVETWGSAPRGVGAKMAITMDGNLTGSVSGGCVEGAVVETGIEVLDSGQPRLLHFGVADETAWDVGLACGGSIEVFVEPLDYSAFNFIKSMVRKDEPFAVATIISAPEEFLGKKIVVERGGRIFGEIGQDIDGVAAASARAAIAGGKTVRRSLNLTDADDEAVELFIEVIPPVATLVVVGGVHIALALTSIANQIGYRTIVIDPRRTFGSQDRFSHVDQLIQAWPDEAFSQLKLSSSTAVVNLSHDPKIDDPALKIALASPAFYVGALGSRKTHAARRKRLIEAGISPDVVERIHGPIGLDIGAQAPEEIAVAIMAQIIEESRRRYNDSG